MFHVTWRYRLFFYIIHKRVFVRLEVFQRAHCSYSAAAPHLENNVCALDDTIICFSERSTCWPFASVVLLLACQNCC